MDRARLAADEYASSTNQSAENGREVAKTAVQHFHATLLVQLAAHRLAQHFLSLLDAGFIDHDLDESMVQVLVGDDALRVLFAGGRREDGDGPFIHGDLEHVGDNGPFTCWRCAAEQLMDVV